MNSDEVKKILKDADMIGLLKEFNAVLIERDALWELSEELDDRLYKQAVAHKNKIEMFQNQLVGYDIAMQLQSTATSKIEELGSRVKELEDEIRRMEVNEEEANEYD